MDKREMVRAVALCVIEMAALPVLGLAVLVLSGA
jgi:hypothetical protein